MIGRSIAAAVILLLCGAGYVLSPFVAAWNLREAIKAADTATLERKIVWSTVRTSLRASIAANSQLLPEATEAGERVRPSLWQRVKSAFGQSMLDRFIESYVTPEGLPKLFRYRSSWNGTVKGETDEEDKLDFFERAKVFYRRLSRAEFQSPTRIEIEMIDKFQTDRRYVSVMELHGSEWKLAELRIIGGSAKPVGARMARDMIGVQ
jgi:hypothetical protein